MRCRLAENEVTGWLRKGTELEEVPEMNGWTSPLLGIRFETSHEKLLIFGPDGRPFLTYLELCHQVEELQRQREERGRRRAEPE